MHLYGGPDDLTGDDVERRVDQHRDDGEQSVRPLSMLAIRRFRFMGLQIVTSSERRAYAKTHNVHAFPWLRFSL